MIRLLFCLFLVLTGCTSQMNYIGYLEIKNVCLSDIRLRMPESLTSNSENLLSPEKELLLRNNEKALVGKFQMLRKDGDISSLFDDDYFPGNSNYKIYVYSDNQEKVLYAQDIIKLINNGHSLEKMWSSKVYYLIETKELCSE